MHLWMVRLARALANVSAFNYGMRACNHQVLLAITDKRGRLSLLYTTRFIRLPSERPLFRPRIPVSEGKSIDARSRTRAESLHACTSQETSSGARITYRGQRCSSANLSK